MTFNGNGILGISSTLLPIDQKSNEKQNDLNELSCGIFLSPLRHFFFFMAIVGAWYICNGMNGIAMQSLSAALKNDWPSEQSWATSLIMALQITALQLLLGGSLGGMLLVIHSRFFRDPSFVGSALSPMEFLTKLTSSLREPNMFLGLLHGMGSMSTNIGFLIGSASLVQTIKLLEPFETLLLTKLITPADKKIFSPGIVSSMVLTICATTCFVKNPTSQTNGPAIFFALVSGLTLSTRNVLQRKQHQEKSELRSSSSPLQRSIFQFTELSLQSGILLSMFCFLSRLVAFFFPQLFVFRKDFFLVLFQELNWSILFWHPLYNVFSMATLGFCSAVTHSLLNAGKRIVAIIMAMLWYCEALSLTKAVALFLLILGGFWYTVESQIFKSEVSAFHWKTLWKPLLSILLLQCLYFIFSI